MKKLKIIVTFIFLTLITISMTSCVVRLSESHGNMGKHRGWYKNNNHRDHKVYIIKKDNHKQPKAKHTEKGKNKKKDRWDAKK